MSTIQPRKRLRASSEARRAQIIDEAVRLIGQRGYHGFGIRELAQTCQMTDAGLLHYFGSKEKLLIAVLEDRDRRIIEFVVSATPATLTEEQASKLAPAQVREIFHLAVVRSSAQPELLRLIAVLQAEAMNADHPAYDYFRKRQHAVVQEFARLVAPFTPAPRGLALAILAQLIGLEQEWLRSDCGFDIVAQWGEALTLLLPTP